MKTSRTISWFYQRIKVWKRKKNRKERSHKRCRSSEMFMLASGVKHIQKANFRVWKTNLYSYNIRILYLLSFSMMKKGSSLCRCWNKRIYTLKSGMPAMLRFDEIVFFMWKNSSSKIVQDCKYFQIHSYLNMYN